MKFTAIMLIRKNIFDYLTKLDDNDFRKIKRYLDSPFFSFKNRNKVIELFKILKNHHPNYEKATDPFLAKKLNIAINSLRNAKSELIKCIENYLELKTLEKEKHLKTQLLAQAFDELNMHQQFKKYADLHLETLEKKPYLNEEDYKLKYELLKRKYTIIAQNMLDANNTDLQEAINTLTRFYLYECLNNLNGLKSTNHMVDQGAEITLSNQIVNSINNIELIDDINIKASYLIYKFYNLNGNESGEKEQTYHTLKQMVLKDWAKLTDDCKYETYQHMVNMALIGSKFDSLKFNNEAFLIHKFWIEKKVHQIHPEMHYHTFLSVVILSCSAQKFDWCKNFIEENEQMIPVKDRMPTVNLSSAYHDFSTNQFDNAIKKLYTTEPLGVYFDLMIRILMLKCLFVAKYENRFVYSFNNTYSFIRNHDELNENTKKNHLQFIAYIKKVRNARLENNIKKLSTIKNEIETNANNIQNSTWLIDTIKKLIDKN